MKNIDIAIDFDGCIVTCNYPKIGILRNRAKHYINKWYNQGHTIIINTCRSGKYQKDAEKFLVDNGIKYHTVNKHTPRQVIQYPVESRKMSADLYIDDRDSRRFVDWDFEDTTVIKMSNEKPLIITITGKSGSGKTTWAEYIEKEFGISMIQSHTDRDKRSPDENGHTFHTGAEFDKFHIKDMLAFVNFGDYRYCCLRSDLKMRNTYVIDESGISQLNHEEYDIITIRMHCSQRKLNERIGKERAARDEGKFSWFHPWVLRFSRYDYFVNTGKSEANCRKKIKKIIKRIYKDY